MEMFYIGRYLHITQGRGFCADRASETEAYFLFKKDAESEEKTQRSL